MTDFRRCHVPGPSLFSPSALRPPSDSLPISLPCRAPVPFGLFAPVSGIEDTPPNDNHVGAFFQNHLPRAPPSLTEPIPSTAGGLVFRFETLRAIRRKVDTRGEIHKSVLRRRIQCLLRDKADDKLRVLSGSRYTCARVCRRHEVPFAAHLREQQKTPRVRRRPQVLQRLFPIARAGAFAG